MLSFDVTVPEFGETITLQDGGTVVGDGKSVAVTIHQDKRPVVALVLPAETAMELSQAIWSAAREADPENTNLIATLRRSFAGNA